MDGGLNISAILRAHEMDTDIFRDNVYRSLPQIQTSTTDLAMAAPSHGVGRGNFKLENKMTDNVYSKIKDQQAIRDVRIELCKSSFLFSFENAVIGAGTVSKVPSPKTPPTSTLSN